MSGERCDCEIIEKCPECMERWLDREEQRAIDKWERETCPPLPKGDLAAVDDDLPF